MRYAVVEGGVIRTIEEYPDDLVVGVDIIHPDLAAKYRAIGAADLHVGDAYEPAPN